MTPVVVEAAMVDHMDMGVDLDMGVGLVMEVGLMAMEAHMDMVVPMAMVDLATADHTAMGDQVMEVLAIDLVDTMGKSIIFFLI